jgi:hypothetical protein
MKDMVTFKYSKTLGAIQSRLRRLPKLTEEALSGQTKKDVLNVIKEFQNGIRANNFRLTPTQSGNKPLYGAGDSKQNSLINALSYRKLKNGWKLVRRRAKHHDSDLPLNVLLAIHEHGAIIEVTDKMRAFLHYIDIHLKKSTDVVRIPPRPVVDKAIKRMLRKKKRNEPAASVRKAIDTLIRTGNENELKKLAIAPGGDGET